MSKYSFGSSEREILPNILGLKDPEEIDKAEFEGFLFAEISLSDELSKNTKFDVEYIKNIHFQALHHLYGFAGKYRNVNMSKGGFTFPAAQFLPSSMNSFQNEILQKLPDSYDKQDTLIEDLATVHAELLFIHPFRDGNGRTARLLANLMARKQGIESLNFDKISDEVFPRYVSAVQSAASKDYRPMVEVMKLVF